jgi:8-amino-7-oxononanoate synthase
MKRTVPPPAAATVSVRSRAESPLLDKCAQFTRARELEALGLYPYFKEISDSEDTMVTIEGRERVMLGSNNYLGLTHHPKVLEAAEKALNLYGSGCTGSRFLNGTLDLHTRLEADLAEFMEKEACMVFSTGYSANLGLITGLVARNETVFLDKLDHASIVDGAQLSFGEAVRFRHTDLDDLEHKLEQHSSDHGALIIVDGVYSMDGIIANVPELVRVADKFGVVLAIDDAHSIGVLGPNGDGTAAHFGLKNEVDIVVGTFSKSFASVGGFVAASEQIIHYLRHHSRTFIFSAALPPASTASVQAALEVMQQEPERRENLWQNTRRWQVGLENLGFDTGETQTPVVPVIVGELEDTFLFWCKLFDAGVFTNPVVPPAVPESKCRLRTSLMATHSFEQIDFCLEAIERVGRELGVI